MLELENWRQSIDLISYLWAFLQASMVKDAPISVSRVTWSPDGNFVGMCMCMDD